MNQHPSQTYTNLWALPLATRIISGVGPIFMGQGFLEFVGVISWISQSPSLSTEVDIPEVIDGVARRVEADIKEEVESE
jgi:hypothetical protein